MDVVELAKILVKLDPADQTVLRGYITALERQAEMLSATSVKDVNVQHLTPSKVSTENFVETVEYLREEMLSPALKLPPEEIEERELVYKTIINNARAGVDILDLTNFDGKDSATAQLFLRNTNMAEFLQSAHRPMITPDAFFPIFAPEQPNQEPRKDLVNRIIQDIYYKKRSRETFRLQYSPEVYYDIDALHLLLEVNSRVFLIRFFRNVTEELRKEQLIQDHLKELNRKNTELQTYIESNMQLENFAYIASHDLRAPIRSMVSFANLLEKRLEGRLDQTEQEFLQFIINGAQNMQALISDLLEFSRANTQKSQIDTIQLNDLRQAIEEDLDSLLKEEKAVLQWSFAIKEIKADFIKLKQLLENLILNGIKFTLPEVRAEVSINLREEANNWLFEIKDNGIGIAKEFQDKIFLIFKRLHTEEEYKGTGIGLALCKKLVEQHNGRIWLDSIDGEGSSFYFTIPKDLY